MIDLILPPRCDVCRKGGREPICPECFSQIKFMKPHLGIFSACEYEGVVRDVLHRLKFQKRKVLVRPLGVLLVRYISQSVWIRMKEIDFIVPVPLHRLRHKQRGFNQAELLAEVVGRYFEVPVLPALERLKNTRPQFDLKREERIGNIKGAFGVNAEHPVLGKRILLFDDIFTTGSTVGECCRELQKAGARKVEILTLARAAL